MLPIEVVHIGDGLIQVSKPEYLKKILVEADIEQHYIVEKLPFARGNFGTVRRVTHKETGINYAAKFLRRRRRAACWVKQIQHEIAVLLLSENSDQIVKLHAVYETRSEFVLVLEMAAGGELQAILDEDGNLCETKTRTCIREVLKAVDYLHRRKVAHLDIKPQNILLKSNNLEDGLKLCDFGFSRAIEGTENICEIQGTPDYVAPEIVQYEPLSLKTDCWSIGVLAYVLLSGFSPFGGDDKQETFLNITQCNLTFPDELFEGVSDDAIDFIKCTLRLKPSDRLDVSECMNHKWLADTPKSITPPPQEILAVQTANVTIMTIPAGDIITVEVAELAKSEEIVDNEEDKENSESKSAQNTPPSVAKLVLEKSLSISLFPDAPTTPKVSRKMLYDDEDDLKEIVKKYQNCNSETSGDCLPPHPPSLELC